MTTIENLAGVPDAGELTILANELFPDLTEGVYGIPEADIPVASVPEVNASQGDSAIPLTDVFDWEHPFAYGGGYSDPYLQTVEAVSAPEAELIPGAGDVPVLTGTENTSYAPAVMSKEQAKENDRKIDAPTSLGGDRVTSESKAAPASSRNDSIRIGSKSLAQIRDDFPILKEQINGHPLVWLDNGATTQRHRS